MNDSLSVSSSYSSSNNSNSNSLNRSLFANSSYSVTGGNANNQQQQHLLTAQLNSKLAAVVNDTMMIGSRRRAKSQVSLDADDFSSIAENNKQLINDLIYLKKQLKEKDAMIDKLNGIRNDLESETRELSASLFEEAYSMVNQAKAEAKKYEILLKEANGKIEVLQAEVQALKQLVLTSAPSTPNKHLLANNANIHHKSHSRQSSLNQQTINQIIVTQQQLTTKPNATSTPSAANYSLSHSHPETSKLAKTINHNSSASLPANCQPKEKVSLFKSHRRAPSHNDIPSQTKSFIDKIFLSSSTSMHQIKKNGQQSPPLPPPKLCVEQAQTTLTLNCRDENLVDCECEMDAAEIDPVYFKEVIEWKENPELNSFSSEFMRRVHAEDVSLCLDFQDKKLAEELMAAIIENSVCIEDLTNSQQPSESFPQ